MDNMDYIHLINYFLYIADGDISLVDNKRMNVVMLAVGAGNFVFVTWAYDHVEKLAREWFNWKQRSTGGRNVRCLTQQRHSHREIKTMMESLADKKWVDKIKHPDVPGVSQRTGGISEVHRRARPSDANDAGSILNSGWWGSE